MTIPSTNGGEAATKVPVKPLRREGIRCKKLSHGLRSCPVIETIPAAGLSTAVARAGVVVRPASATGRDPCRVRRQYRSSRITSVQHLQLALLNSRSLSWQRPTTRDKLYSNHFRLHRRICVYFGGVNRHFAGPEVQNCFSKWRIGGANWK